MIYKFLLIICFELALIEAMNEVEDQVSEKANNLWVPKFWRKQQPINIGGTQLKTGTYYCIEGSDNQYLRWDGNIEDNVYGLIFNGNHDCHNNDVYHFELETNENQINNDVRIKSAFIEKYLTQDSWGRFILCDYVNELNESLVNEMRLNVYPNGLYSIKSKSELNPSFVSSTHTLDKHKIIYYLSSEKAYQKSYIKFIAVNNRTIKEKKLALNLNINSFEYEMFSEAQIEESAQTLSLNTPIEIKNLSPTSLSHPIFIEKSVNESLEWHFNQSLFIFENISAYECLPDFIKRYNKFNEFNDKIDLKSLYQSKRKINKEVDYSINMSYIQIPPSSEIEINAHIDQVEKLSIPFKAQGSIEGFNTFGALSLEQIISIINNYTGNHYRILNTTKNSLIIEIDGYLEAKFGIRSYFNVNDLKKLI